MFAKALTKPQDHAAGAAASSVRHPVRVPAVFIRETDEAILVIADMPGVSEDHVEVTLDEDVLTLRGSTAPDPHEGFQLLYREYETAGFERSFTVPAQCERHQVAASVKHGVVTVTLPKQKAVQPRRIAVKAG